MKRLLSLLALIFTLGLATVATDADASKRLGSGKSVGTQRQAAPDKAPAAAQSSAAAPAAAAPSRSWMGPVAGLAAGLGLAALASHMGFGDELASMVMMGLLAVAVMVAVGFVMRKRAAAKQSAGSGSGGMQYAHVNSGGARRAESPDLGAPAYKVSMPEGGRSIIGSGIGSSIGAGSGAALPGASQIPVDFDVTGFERNAKVNFIRLQAANDAGNLDDIREFTSPEMFAELQMQIAERGTVTQKSEVTSIHAQVIEVAEELDRHIVSIRFTGVIHVNNGEPDETFDEVWHLMKPCQGSSGWVLSGIQQMLIGH